MTDTAEIQRRLSDLAGARARTYGARTKIREAAESRLEDVRGRLAELRGSAPADDAAAKEYQALTEEAGRLELVLAQAGNG